MTVETVTAFRGGAQLAAGLALLMLAACASEESAVPAGRDDAICPRGSAPIVHVAVARGEPLRDDSLSLDELSHLDEAAFGKVALGATVSKFAMPTQIAAIAAPSLGAGFCAYLTRVDVVLKFSPRIVHVAREFHDEPCVHDEVLAHELRHVALDDKMLTEEGSALAAELPSQLGMIGAVWGTTREAAKAALQERALAIEGKESERFAQRRRLAHAQQIDTPAESQRVQRMCNGRVPQLLAIWRNK